MYLTPTENYNTERNFWQFYFASSLKSGEASPPPLFPVAQVIFILTVGQNSHHLKICTVLCFNLKFTANRCIIMITI